MMCKKPRKFRDGKPIYFRYRHDTFERAQIRIAKWWVGKKSDQSREGERLIYSNVIKSYYKVPKGYSGGPIPMDYDHNALMHTWRPNRLKTAQEIQDEKDGKPIKIVCEATSRSDEEVERLYVRT